VSGSMGGAATNISAENRMADLREPTPASVWRNPIHFLAFGFGSGAAPRAPGTFGTLAALPFVLLWQQLPPGGYSLVLVLSTLLGIWLCHRTSVDLGVHDHGGIVWDEFVGLWIALWLAPTGWAWLLAGFLLFRLFDIWKPWPIGWVDRRVHGGLGIMLDDIIAGFMALGVLLVAEQLFAVI
jgi:phosphatidylglycerophosphatase A